MKDIKYSYKYKRRLRHKEWHHGRWKWKQCTNMMNSGKGGIACDGSINWAGDLDTWSFVVDPEQKFPRKFWVQNGCTYILISKRVTVYGIVQSEKKYGISLEGQRSLVSRVLKPWCYSLYVIRIAERINLINTSALKCTIQTLRRGNERSHLHWEVILTRNTVGSRSIRLFWMSKEVERLIQRPLTSFSVKIYLL